MREFVITEMTKEEYNNILKKELFDKGLRKAVTDVCKEIDEICHDEQMRYIPHRSIQESLCKIEDLIKMYEKEKKERNEK